LFVLRIVSEVVTVKVEFYSKAMAAGTLDYKAPINFDDEPPRAASVASATPSNPEGERKVRRDIEEAAPQNTKLLNDIQSTEGAVNALQNNELSLDYAKEELRGQDKTVSKATYTSRDEFSKYTHRKHSKTTRWYYILTRMKQNYESKLKEAEQSYHNALAVQSQAEKRQQELQQDIRAIEEENSKLEKLAEKHVEAHKAIDKLYAAIFTGPTPGFPDEDEREQTFKVAEAEHKATSQTLQAMTKASKNTQSIKTSIENAQDEIKSAEHEIDSAFFVADYTQIFVKRAARFVGRAMQLQEQAVEALPEPLDRSLVKVQDNLKTRLDAASRHITAALQAVYPSRGVLYDLIQDASDELKHSMDAQTEMARLTRQYEVTAKESVRISSRAMEDARQALQEIRQGAFEITVGFGAAAPAYNECCDRAEWYANDVYAQCERIPVPAVDENSLPPLPSYEQAVG
jgi:hypothetical protein